MLEKTILKNLVKNNDYTKKVLPFLKSEYFSLEEDRIIFEEISKFISKYNTSPPIETLDIELNSLDCPEETMKQINIIISDIRLDTEDSNEKWLIDATEEFCQDKAIYLAMSKCIDIMNGTDKKLAKGSIPNILTNALAISFDPNIGHDYLEASTSRFDYYHQVLDRIPFDLDFFNKITKMGVAKKTLNVALAGTGVGKTLMLSHHSASCLSMGKNVLYITMEIAEEEIGKRIDANLLNISFDDLMILPKDVYDNKIENLKSKTHGRLIIKEYAPTTASVTHFRALLNDLKLKKNFVPDIIFVDYINICMSSRLKPQSGNSYEYVKAIAEELRGLAVEYKVPVFSATQTNRAGFGSSDVELTDTAESFGLPQTADFMFALIVTEDLDKLNQIMVKQLKNRYSDPTKNKRFVIGIDRSKQRLYDLENSAQDNLDRSGQEPEEKDMRSTFKKLKGNSKRKFQL